MGVGIFYEIFKNSEGIFHDVDQQITDEINRLLMEPGKKLAVPINTLDISRGDTGKLVMGIKNTDPDYTKFKIETTCVKFCSETCKPCQNRVINDERIVNIAQREKKIFKLYINVPKDAEYGEYIYSLEVKKYDGANTQGAYDTAKRFYVRVG